MTKFAILAPLAGWSAPLSEIPDAVFAQAMLGEGAAIDPLSREMRAPCDGEVISIAAARHAVALRSASGAEILVHVGVDTVGLAGNGFEVHVRNGDRVRAGDLLLSFDIDAVARRARSLMTPVIVTNGDRFRVTGARVHREVKHGDVLFEIEEVGAAQVGGSAGAAPVVSEAIVVEHAHGIHARPAALIAKVAKTLPHEIELRARGRGATARSAVALMSLGVRGGDEVVINGFEPAAAAGVAAIARVIRELEKGGHAVVPATTASTAPGPADAGRLRGVVASRGYAVGHAFYLQHVDIPVVEYGQGFEQESAAFDRSREEVRARLARLAATAAPTLREILSAHLELLDDPQLLQDARAAIRQGKSAGFAWRGALRASASALLATGDARIGERVDDLRDLEQQVLVALGGAATVRAEVPAGSILVARDLAPSQFIDLDTKKLGGIALSAGGPTSHVAILAAAAGVPMLVAVGPSLLEVAPGASLVLDAEDGAVRVAPDESELGAALARVAERSAARERERATARRDCHLASGERIEVFANLTGTVADAELAVNQGAEGCGLLRTEFLFLERATAPSEDEQLRCYQEVARVLGDRPLIIRTMDIGGDKPIPYLPLPPEDNPALGLRGIRTSLWRQDLFETQLRALLRVSSGERSGQCRILLPMITEPGEVRAVRALIEKLRDPAAPAPQLGAMIETPASALLAEQIAAEVDFLSIGTNDLTQYTLAMDRGNAAVAARVDGLHPAVLALVARVGEAGERRGKLVAVCGGLASDPVAAPLLLGLGVRELSVVPNLIPALKARVSTLKLDDCRALAARALRLDSAEAVRHLAREVLP
ncbi:MAG TPA: phosphoenolpyruvate--protein phosphotransferase [Steroidobacteraceae bacterium]|nr:phosphoenolpyruvate--protein phosphotransferase [Steroidobacteraceae bacterium]